MSEEDLQETQEVSECETSCCDLRTDKIGKALTKGTVCIVTKNVERGQLRL
jgi:hypothetical protein